MCCLVIKQKREASDIKGQANARKFFTQCASFTSPLVENEWYLAKSEATYRHPKRNPSLIELQNVGTVIATRELTLDGHEKVEVLIGKPEPCPDGIDL